MSGRRGRSWTRRVALASCLLGCAVAAEKLAAQDERPYLADRGPGVQTSLFGTYLPSGRWMIYPFYEYGRNTADEYKPSELGFVGDQDFLGTSTEHEALLYVAYGVSDRVIVEVEGALWAKATLEKAAEDPSDVPTRIEESGLGEIEAQVRWRWRPESAERPELFSFVEIAFPFQRSKKILGAQDWEVAFGLGAIRGFGWGTLSVRASVAYEAGESQVELGEYAIEYLKRTSDRWRWVATLEGEDDEVSAIGEAQWWTRPNVFFKFNCGFGLTEKAPDVAPEIGVVVLLGR